MAFSAMDVSGILPLEEELEGAGRRPGRAKEEEPSEWPKTVTMGMRTRWREGRGLEI